MDYNIFKTAAFKCPFTGELFEDETLFAKHFEKAYKFEKQSRIKHFNKFNFSYWLSKKQKEINSIEEFVSFFSLLETQPQFVVEHIKSLYDGDFGNIELPAPVHVEVYMLEYNGTKELDLEKRYDSSTLKEFLLFDFRFSTSNFKSGDKSKLFSAFDCYIDLMQKAGRWQYAFYVEIDKWKWSQIEVLWLFLSKKEYRSFLHSKYINNFDFEPSDIIRLNQNNILTKSDFLTICSQPKTLVIDYDSY